MKFPYVRTYEKTEWSDVVLTRAVCRDARCLLESNIALLPGTIRRETDSATYMLELEARNREVVSASGNATYLNHPLSMAIDNRPDTYFESQQGWIALFFRRHVAAIFRMSNVADRHFLRRKDRRFYPARFLPRSAYATARSNG
jgi:hypothetical protein